MNVNCLIFIFFLLISCSDSKFLKNQAISSNSKNLDVYDSYLKEGKLDSAKIYIEQLYKNNPNDKNILTRRGDLYFLLAEFEFSEESWLKCVLIDPTDKICYEKLIGLYCGVYDVMEQKCSDIILETLKLNINKEIAMFFKAKRFLKEENVKEAINLFKKLLEKTPNNLRVLNELAVLYDTSYLSEFYYNKMLDIDSSYLVFNGLGSHFRKKYLFKKAIKNYKKALTIKQTKDAYYNIGYCYLKIDSFNNAIDSFSKAINIDGSLSEAYFARGYAYAKSNQNKLAIEDYKFCLMLDPGHPEARIELEKIK